MTILSLENITKSYGERYLFDKASFYLQEGEKVGIFGINGTGKSTLLKIMAGTEEPDEGIVTKASHVVCSLLPQHPVFEDKDTIIYAVLKSHEKNGSSSENIRDKETEAKSILTKLGIRDFGVLCGTLSGGERKRLALAAALLAPSDILILDEPTNHLDNDMNDWLEEQLKKRTGAVVMVTHDRYFLDSISTRIVELDKGKIYSYDASYSGYLELKASRESSAQASERKRQSILKKELEWVKRGAQARSTKQRARLERYEDLKQTAAPVTDHKVEMGSAASRLGKSTIELQQISKRYGDKILLQNFSYVFLKNDRIGFIGSNGCGKTTLMKMLTGTCQPDSGSIAIGQTVKMGYYAQEIGESEMPSDKKVIDYIRDVAEYVQTNDGSVTASQMLERFLFEGKEQYGLLGKLSGGERRRLNLLKVLMGAPNVLLLDEPTNDLDITTLTVLEDYLDSFPGIVIIISHDRYFLDRTVRRIFAFEGKGQLKQYEGGYTDYRKRKAEADASEGTQVSAETTGSKGVEKKNKWKKTSAKIKFSFQEQRDYEIIEKELAELEGRLEALDEEVAGAATDFVKLNQLMAQKEELETLQEEKMNRWMYLEDLKAKIDAQ